MGKTVPANGARTALIRVAKIHVLIGLVFAGQIIAYDAAKLITPEIVLKRWVALSIFLLGAFITWYLARLNNSLGVARNLVWFLVATDLIFASYMVYSTRGMASKAVFLFILPILVAACLKRKGAIYLVAALSATSYIVTAIAYFALNFNEGYKIELYGEIAFYGTLLIAIGGMAWALVRTKK